MDLKLKDILKDYRRKSLDDFLVTDNDYFLTDKEARAYLEYCINKGYTYLYECPEYESVQSEINKKGE